MNAIALTPSSLVLPGAAARKCDTTGLNICLRAQKFIKLHAVCGVVFLLLGGIAAILLALTRWQAVHLLPVDWFYRILTFHGLNMLIFWILFFEVAILYFACTIPLNCRLFSKGIAWVGFLMMLGGALLVDYTIMMGKADVMMTSYLPLLAHPNFYLGIILVAVGTLLHVFNFFGTIFIAKRDKTYEGSMPLVSFGALTAAIIAVLTLAHGAIVMIPTWSYSMGWTGQPDPLWYRMTWWGLGHMSQQVNVAAMVSVWYLIGSLATGAKPVNETVCRGAFVLYILFINLASAHHLLVDPAVGSTWKIWNTSYAMYLAVLASMVHGFTVPASIEIAMRKKGHGKGLFGWVMKLPWRNPAFAASVLSMLIFGFIGGITGVTLGTQQINISAHNTLRITGHFHSTVVGGTTLAFMGLAYYVIPLIFRRDFIWKKLARLQPWLFGGGILLVSIGMSFAGSLGVARRAHDIENAGIYGPAVHLFLAIMGVGALIAVTGLILFCLLCVGTLFAGKRNAGRPMDDWGVATATADAPGERLANVHWAMKGTVALTLIFLACFAVYYFANWKALSDMWHVK